MKRFFAILLSITGTMWVSCSDLDSSSQEESKAVLVPDDKDHLEPLKSTPVVNALDNLPPEDQTKKLENNDLLTEEKNDIETNKVEESLLDKKAKEELKFVMELRKKLCPPGKAPFADVTILQSTGIINIIKNCREIQFYPSGEIYTFSGPEELLGG